MQKLVAFYTLGCKLNFSETSTLAREFTDGGFAQAHTAQERAAAEIAVVNTCSVTGDADKKCRYIIRKIHKQNPNAIIAVTGCYAQLKADEIAKIEGVDIVLSNNNKAQMFEKVMSLGAQKTKVSGNGTMVDSCASSEIVNFFAAFSTSDRTRTFLKVQDGCSYHCAYCTIPLARGESRSPKIHTIVEQAQQIAGKGQREIVLTGVNIGDFGRDSDENFLQLIQALDNVDGIERYRISSIEPNLLTDEVIQFCANSAKFMPHFHIPLQAGTNKILASMRRRYTVEKFADRIEQVRRFMPDAFIGVDVIVGFPGETNDDFSQTYELLKGLNPAFLHIFPYSIRPNTLAAEMDGQISTEEKHSRVEKLKGLSDRLHYSFCEQFVGKEVDVLMEAARKEGEMFGYSENYVRVAVPYNKELVGRIVRVRINSLRADSTASAELV